MNLDEARAQIVAALDAVLPGRVYSHPPTSGRAVTPSIFVEQTTADPFSDEAVATFPVWVVADGAVEAQIEAHDGIVWNVMLALYPIALLDAFGMCGAPAPVAYTYNGREAHHANR